MTEANAHLPTPEENAENLHELINFAFSESYRNNAQFLQSEPTPHKIIDIIKQKTKRVIDTVEYLIEKPFDILDDLIEFDEEKISAILEAYGISANQWVFSRGNLRTIHRLIKLIDNTLDAPEQLGILTSLRYLAAWTIIQKLYNKVDAMHREDAIQNQPQQDGPGIDELKQIQEECMYYTKFAHGTYGNLINYILSGKNLLKVFDLSALTAQFLAKAELTKEDLFYAFWAATPYQPAYAIVRDQKKQSIILCMRGSANWADFITDLDCQYVNFSLVKDNETKKTFLRFKYDNATPTKFKHMLGTTTKLLNGIYESELVSENETVLETGYAHIGMFVSAIQSYKEITPRLQQIFSESAYKNYKFVITGHSLGGGMTTLLTFLYTVHPFKVENEKIFEDMRGYAFAPAPVLSKEFDHLLTNRLKSVAFGHDCVPTLSFGAAKDISKAQLMLDAVNKKQPGLIRDILTCDMGENFDYLHKDHMDLAKKEIKLYQLLRNSMRTSLKLHPMGRTFKIDPVYRTEEDNKEYKYVIWEVEDKTYFEEIKLSRNVIQHHFPFYYEDGLSSTQVEFRPIASNEKLVTDTTGY